MSRGLNWTAFDVAKALKKPSRAKYGAKRVQIDGIWFDSKREGARYEELKMMQNAGLIHSLIFHPRFIIGIKGLWICDVYLDFQYWDKSKNGMVYEDVKSAPTNTPLSALKRKMVEADYGITVELIR